MTADVVPRMEAASPALNLPSAAKLRPSPAVPGSMESAVRMWLQVGNVQKLQQVRPEGKKVPLLPEGLIKKAPLGNKVLYLPRAIK